MEERRGRGCQTAFSSRTHSHTHIHTHNYIPVHLMCLVFSAFPGGEELSCVTPV